jgi:aldehyde:ferredoxin oxidoreductase
VKYGKRAGTIAELPDYEAGACNGTNWGIYDIDEQALATGRPDELGFDLISVGNVCSYACEAQEKGVLTAADLGGVQLKWGDTDSFMKVMDLIAYRKGEIPTLLGEGLEPASKKIGKGSEQYASHVKGIEMGAHGSRSLKDRNELSYTVAAQGGDHCSTVIPTGEANIFRDSTGICSFQGLNRDQEIEWLQAITGFGVTQDELVKVLIPRWTTMMRVANLLAGRTYRDDINPPRWYEPLPEGPFKGMKVDKAIETQKKQEFYKNLGWDTQGVPTTATLQACGFSSYDAALAPLRVKA